MRKACIIGSAVFVVIAIVMFPHVFLRLSSPVPQEKPEKFIGVIRLWAVDGYHSGALTWVTKNAASFERKNSGAYIHITRMDEEMLNTRLDRGERPDIIIFPLGTVEQSRELFLSVDKPREVREEYLSSAVVDGDLYATPLMAGGYTLLVNSERIETGALPPPDWNELLDSLYVDNKQEKKRQYGIICPGATQRSAPLALISLIGAEGAHGIANKRGETLHAQFAKCDWDTSMSQFVSGQSAVMPATQREIKRLENLDTAGLNYIAYAPQQDITFTDQVTFAGLVDSITMEDEKRKNTCENFIAQLISETAQQSLADYGTFSVLRNIILYDEGIVPFLSLLEKSLSQNLTIPNTFAWKRTREEFAIRCESYLMGETDKNPLLYLP